ncbi:MAG: hypothetical protein A2910_01975 [Candidatus Yanofskybacteria bacterium RIFCSPLOWO2_01_FULL_39_28]|nr:MAG: hypothetical protein A2910_01975 [Candidatus Yanofskybacteria bacterium RIFCSPLOWO2_01_FULL_39_28]
MKNFLKENWFKLIAIGILIGALWNHPIGYYQLLRWVVAATGAYSAYLAYEHKNNTWAWIFGIIAVLFNPIFPFYFTKETWQVIDVATAVVIFISLIKKKNYEI